MNQQRHLFDTTETVSRVLSTGSTVRIKLEPLGDGHVKILEYYRKARNSDRFVRERAEEGYIVEFSQLGLEPSYEELFGRIHLEPPKERALMKR
jgi:hypothetical protein